MNAKLWAMEFVISLMVREPKLWMKEFRFAPGVSRAQPPVNSYRKSKTGGARGSLTLVEASGGIFVGGKWKPRVAP
jgi:hypothetical protein